MCLKGRKSQALGLDVGSNPRLMSFCLDNCSSFFIFLFYFGPCLVFVAVFGLSLAAASGLLVEVASLAAEHGRALEGADFSGCGVWDLP